MSSIIGISQADNRVKEFKSRILDDRQFCEQLFTYATTRLLAHKYLYYVHNVQAVKDIAYDLEEQGWFIMGYSLGHLCDDERSPCVDYNAEHPLAEQGRLMADKWRISGG